MEFEDFPKEYEDVFTSEKTLRKLKIEEVSTDLGWDISTYITRLRTAMEDFQLSEWNHAVKAVWLFRHFHYRGVRRNKRGASGIFLDGAFSVFMRRYVGYDSGIIMKSPCLNKILTYFDDFFPKFDLHNPFEEEYAYPYQYMSFECLVLVYGMEERLELLKRGEAKQMGYAEFYDYVINYISCYNAKYGVKYEFSFSTSILPYIKKHYEGKKI